MKFEWSRYKNEANIRKHHLDFSDAWAVFESPMFIEVDDRRDYRETRYTGVGFLRDLVVLLVFSEKEDDIIRIISLRKAVKYEREEFFKYLQDQLGTAESDAG